MGMIKYSTALILTGLFAFAVIGFAFSFGTDNNADILLESNQDLVNIKNNTYSNLIEFNDSGKTSYDNFFDATFSTDSDSPQEGGAQFKVTWSSALDIAQNAFETSYRTVFGGGDDQESNGFEIFLLTGMALLLFVGGLYGWAALFGRNVD